jgi:excisionase family DNA binding protein
MAETISDRFISLTEACGYLGVKRNTLLKMIAEQGLPAVKIGKLWKFKISLLDAWVEENNSSN